MAAEFVLRETAHALETRIRANRLVDFPAEWRDELVFPYYDGLSLWNVAHTIGQALGVALPGMTPLDAVVWGGEPPAGIKRVVLFLTDGLGYLFLRQLIDDDPELRAAVSDLTEGRGPVPLTSVLPSTTAVALPTLWTARTPAAHAMLGTIMYLREFSMLGDMLSYKPATGKHPSDTFEQWGINPEDFITVSGLSELLASAGIPTHVVLDYKLSGTGLSRILHRGVQHRHVHMSYADFWLRLRDVLRGTARQNCCVSIYWPAVDSLSHMYGMDTPYTRAEVKSQLTRLRDVLADEAVHDGQTLVMILADHGHHDAPQAIDVQEDKRAAGIREAMRCGMAAEMRFPNVYVRDDHRQAVIDTVEREFADCVTWIEGEAAIKAGLFGPEIPHTELAHRAGDVILIPRLGWRVVEPTINFRSTSLHGGLADYEMLVPFMWRQI